MHWRKPRILKTKKYMNVLPENLKISVIITAYNRRDYLLRALNSVLNQTLDRDLFEIIVIKNYKDNEIDQQIIKSGSKLIFSDDKALGAKFIKGFLESSGDVVCILEDDDLFYRHKLEEVLYEFERDQKLIFYQHPTDVKDVNSLKLISNGLRSKERIYEYPPTKKKIRSLLKPISKRGVYNNSSYCIRKTALESDFGPFHDMVKSCDDFLFLYLLSARGRIKLGKNVLGIKTIFIPDGGENRDYKRYLEETLKSELETIETYKAYNVFFHGTPQLEVVNYYMRRAKFRSAIYGRNQLRFKDLISALSLSLKFSDVYLMVLSFWFILSKVKKEYVLSHFFQTDGLRKRSTIFTLIKTFLKFSF